MTEKRRRRGVERTQDSSVFSAFLERLVASVPGCRAAAFVDAEGEAVDLGGHGDEFEIKVAAAELLILLDVARSLPGGEKRAIIVGTPRRSYLARALPEGYAIVLELAPGAAFAVSERALVECALAIAKEAGFAERNEKTQWFAVEVLPRGSRRVRPKKAKSLSGSVWHDVDVLGAVVGLGKRERGYRVRLTNGAEMTLLREPMGKWWSDEPLE